MYLLIFTICFIFYALGMSWFRHMSAGHEVQVAWKRYIPKQINCRKSTTTRIRCLIAAD